MAFSLAKVSGLWDQMCGQHRLALLIAALCHDIEHPGVSASYLQKSQSRLAVWFDNDLGLLEKHHSVRAFELLACKNLRLLETLPTDERVALRHLVRDAILATDMSRHAAYMTEIEEGLVGCPLGAGAGPLSPPHLRACLQLLLKCADVSNVTKPFDIAKEWGTMVTDEMFAQGDRERAAGIEVLAAIRSRPLLSRGLLSTSTRTVAERRFLPPPREQQQQGACPQGWGSAGTRDPPNECTQIPAKERERGSAPRPSNRPRNSPPLRAARRAAPPSGSAWPHGPLRI